MSSMFSAASVRTDRRQRTVTTTPHRLRLVVDAPDRRPGRWIWVIRAVLIVSGWAALGVQWLPAGSPIRPVVLFAFVFVAPGASVVLLLPIVDRLERLMVSLGLSASLGIVVSEAFALLHAASARSTVAVLAGLTTVMVGVGAFRRRPERKVWLPAHGPVPLPGTLRVVPSAPASRPVVPRTGGPL